MRISDWSSDVCSSDLEIADTAQRLCFDGSNRQPKFIIPSIRDNIARGVMPAGLILASALWCRYCYGTDEQGQAIPPNDPNWEVLTATAHEATQHPARWIDMRAISCDLAEQFGRAQGRERVVQCV